MQSQVLALPLVVKSADEIKADSLARVYNGLIQMGYTQPNTGPNTYWDLIFSALSMEVAVIGLQAQIIGDQSMPDTALGSDLDRWLNFFNLPRKTATNAEGGIIVTSSNPSFVPSGTQLQVSGIRYQVLYGGTYGNNETIIVQSIDPGSASNQEAGTTLQWVQTPTYFDPVCTVSETYPISGGIDLEDDETARSRLSSFFAYPISAADPSQIISWAQASDPSVQFACVYPCARGPSTLDVSVFTYATFTSQQRSVDNTKLLNTIAPYINNRLSLGIDSNVTNVVGYPIDISIYLSLPEAVNSLQPGSGLGFLDPAPLQITTAKPAIRVVDGYAISGSNPSVPQNTATSFWVDFPVAPTSNVVYNISFYSPTTLTLTSSKTSGTNIPYSNFASLSSHTSLYYITVNIPFYNDPSLTTPIKTGSWIFPTAQNTQTYITAFQNYMFTMGPGERTANPVLLANGRAMRNPYDRIQYQYKIDKRLTQTVFDSSPEILDANFAYIGIYSDGYDGYDSYYYQPIPNGGSNLGAITDSTAYQVYSNIVCNSDPAYAIVAPPTAFNANGNNAIGPSYIFTQNNIGFYQAP